MTVPPAPTQFDICDTNLDYTYRAMPGIIVAGGCCPVVLVSIFVIVTAVFAGGVGSKAGQPVELLLILLIGTGILAIIGLLVAAVAGAMCAILINSLNLMFGNFMDVRSIVGAVGGLSGYASVTSIILIQQQAFYGSLPIILLFATLAMFMGTFGAMAYLEKNFRYDMELLSHRHKWKVQFHIAHLLIATTIVAIVIGISSLSKRMDFAVVAFYWLFVQAMMIGIVRTMTRRIKANPIEQPLTAAAPDLTRTLPFGDLKNNKIDPDE